VSIDELVLGVNIALGGAALDACPSYDADGDRGVAIEELISAVANAQRGCPGGPTPTARPASPAPSATVTPTATWTAAPGPTVSFFGVTSADDSLQPPSATSPSGIAIYERPFGFGFKLVVEAHGELTATEAGTYTVGGTPDLQIQTTRALGDGSPAVCDVEPPNFGGVPGIDPPQLEDPDLIADALNDLGCRFVDGEGAPRGRTCAEGCVRFDDGEGHCVSDAPNAQFCAPIAMPMAFPEGDTLVTVRVRDRSGRLGSAAQLIIRIAPVGAAEP
jgi:hypothetical protein